jgi:Autophagy-related protein 11
MLCKIGSLVALAHHPGASLTHAQEDQALPDIRAEEVGTTDTAAAAAVHRAAAEAEARGFADATAATAGDDSAAYYSSQPAAHNAPPTASQEARGSVILQPEEAADEDSDVSDGGESLQQGGDAPVTPRRRSRKALTTRNAELQYQNALLRAELMRLQDAARRAGRPPLPPQSPSGSSGAGTPRSSTRRNDSRSSVGTGAGGVAASPSRAVAESGTQAAVVTSDAAVGTSSDSDGTAAAVVVPDDAAAAAAAARRAKEEEYEALRSGLAVIQSLVSEWKADDAARARTNSSALVSSTASTTTAAGASAAAAATTQADSETAAVNAAVSAVAVAAAAAAANSADASSDVSCGDSPVAAVVTAVESALRMMQGRAKAHAMELEHRDEELSSARALAAAAAARRISFCDFEVGDLALFLPTSHDGDSRVYLAFHMNCPHPYLATESVEQICQAEGRFPDYVSTLACIALQPIFAAYILCHLYQR